MRSRDVLNIHNSNVRLSVLDIHARLRMSIRCAAHELSYSNATIAYVCMYVCMYAKHAGIWKLKKSSFDQALRNASKHLRKQRFGHTFWSRQDSGFLGSNC